MILKYYNKFRDLLILPHHEWLTAISLVCSNSTFFSVFSFTFYLIVSWYIDIVHYLLQVLYYSFDNSAQKSIESQYISYQIYPFFFKLSTIFLCSPSIINISSFVLFSLQLIFFNSMPQMTTLFSLLLLLLYMFHCHIVAHSLTISFLVVSSAVFKLPKYLISCTCSNI